MIANRDVRKVSRILIPGVSYTFFWLILTLVLACIEAATLGLVTIWFAVGALFGFFGALAGISLLWQVILFIASATVLLIYTRPIAVKYLNSRTNPTNVDRLVGEKGIVIETIDAINGKGQVRVLGQVWSARAADGNRIDLEEKVEVREISGVKLIVRKVEESNLSGKEE
jgi:membrane protein implicated in regulation of membrane protease activity